VPIDYRCPSCRNLLCSDEQYAGKTGSCPLCGQLLTVPFPPCVGRLPQPFPLQQVVRVETAVRCHDCDRLIPEGQSVRRTIRVGGFGVIEEVLLLLFLAPVWIIVALLWNPVKSQTVSLCRYCNANRDKAMPNQQLGTCLAVIVTGISAAVLVLLLGALILYWVS
jgi:hypothetical protein